MKKYVQILTLAALAVTGVACSGEQKETDAKQQDGTAAVKQEEKPLVKIAQTAQRDVEQIETYTATVESDVKNNISSNTALRIEKIYAEVGDAVSKGQLLVQMDASSLRQLELQIANQEIEFKRVDELYKVGGSSKAEWDNAKTQLDVNRTLYENMKENTRLVSPISGVVTARNYDNGDMSGAAPILTIETLTPVKMIINISENYYTQVTKGMPADVSFDAYGTEEFVGKVSIVYPAVDPVTHTFPVEITLANADRRIRPGMFGRATVCFGIENHVVVPDEAVVKQMGAGEHYVYVYADGKVSRNVVTLGRRLGSEYEVVSGIPAGASVVIAGQNRLADGMEVEVKK